MTAQQTPYVLLLVDDDTHFREGLTRNLHAIRESTPMTMLQADRGEEAMQILGSAHVDCILLDYQMPGGSGLDWMKRFTAAYPHVPIIMITGVGSEDVAVEAMKNGAMDYLVKGSINRETLERAIVNALQKTEMRRTIQRQQEDLLQAERHRVMIESLGAACHHLGQPATVIQTYLELIKGKDPSGEIGPMVDKCLDAANMVSDILHRLQEVGTYRTVPYLGAGQGDKGEETTHILDIQRPKQN